MDDSTASLNGDVSEESAKDASTKGTEKYDPEDPESEPEKDTEAADEKPSEDVKDPKVVLDEVKVTPKSEPGDQEEETPKEQTKTAARSRGPRARRGRRN